MLVSEQEYGYCYDYRKTNQLVHICTVGSPNINDTKSKGRAVSTASTLRFIKGKNSAFSVFFYVSHAAACKRPVWHDAEALGETLFTRPLNPAILIRMVMSEYVRQPLGGEHRRLDGQDEAAPDEVVKGDLCPSMSVKLWMRMSSNWSESG